MSRLPTSASGLVVSAHLLEACGVELVLLFERSRVAWRSVEAVTEDAVELLLGDRAVWVWCHLLPPDLQVGQWLRFERFVGYVAIRLDLRATIRGEARLTRLFESLTAQL